MQIPLLKKCTKCGQTKLIISFQPHKNYADGYTSWCKQCVNDARKNWESEHANERKEYFKQWHQDNIEKNHQRNNARCREQWKNNPEYRERKNKQKKESTKRDPNYPEKSRAWKKNWEKEHGHDPRVIQRKRDTVRVYRFKRRTNRINYDHPLTKQEWHDLCKKYDYRCLCCGEKKPLEVDHIIPVSKGGGHSLSNCQPLCRSCNVKKMQKTIDYR